MPAVPVRALVIDDSAYNRVTLTRMLENHQPGAGGELREPSAITDNLGA